MSIDIFEAIAAERRRQIAKGYDAAHDDQHTKGEIALGAAAYCVSSVKYEGNGKSNFRTIPQWKPPEWPWDREEFHPSGDPRTDLISAAAMIIAEIERLSRQAPHSSREGK